MQNCSDPVQLNDENEGLQGRDPDPMLSFVVLVEFLMHLQF